MVAKMGVSPSYFWNFKNTFYAPILANNISFVNILTKSAHFKLAMAPHIDNNTHTDIHF